MFKIIRIATIIALLYTSACTTNFNTKIDRLDAKASAEINSQVKVDAKANIDTKVDTKVQTGDIAGSANVPAVTTPVVASPSAIAGTASAVEPNTQGPTPTIEQLGILYIKAQNNLNNANGTTVDRIAIVFRDKIPEDSKISLSNKAMGREDKTGVVSLGNIKHKGIYKIDLLSALVPFSNLLISASNPDEFTQEFIFNKDAINPRYIPQVIYLNSAIREVTLSLK